ncbi:PAS domain-containing protein [bacterium]|nr:PAS domain-containing protein [bacterium]
MNQPVSNVSLRLLLKAVLVVSAVPVMAMMGLVVMGELQFGHAMLGSITIMAAFSLLVRPYLANILTLTRYVDDLAQDRRVEPPELTLVQGLEPLMQSLVRMHRSYERKRQQMEAIIDEREILVDSIPDVLIMVDSNLSIVRTNASARQLLGQNLAYRRLEDVVSNETLLRTVREAYEQGRDKEVEFYLDKSQDEYYRAKIDHFPARSPGGIAVIITMHNMTEIKRSEQMRADFVANASHEIRTPLASIIGFIETLQGPAKNDQKAREQFLSIMSDQSRRMSSLVNDLLSLSKIEMSANTTPTGSVNMAEVIHKVKEHLEWATKEKNMKIECNLSDNLPMVRGDENELMQVVHNLVSNAIKYGKADTPIVVSAEVTNRFPPDKHVVMQAPVLKISVSDQSEGIAPEHIPRLTERFYRVATGSNRKVSGTGLGLAIVKHILHRHKAILDVKSIVGVGSSFSVYLPIRQREVVIETP